METLRALGIFCEPPTREHASIAQALGLPEPPEPAAHTECFVFQLYPYASVYLGNDGMLGGEARDRIAGFWRALGMTPPAEPDHLTLMLSMYAGLADACRAETDHRGASRGAVDPLRRDALESAKRAYFWEHLASWLPPYLDKVREVGSPFYREWAGLLGQVLAEEAKEIGERETLPLHLREAAPLPGAECSLDELLSALLAPARSGMLLVRDDLRRAARELGLGARRGERRFVLRALFAQDTARTLEWLAQEADRWAQRHAERSGPIARDWARRARATSNDLAAFGTLIDAPLHATAGL